MTPIRTGLFGLGNWVKEAYVPILKELPEIEIVAIAAKSPATRVLAKDLFGSHVALADAYQDLLADSDMQAVIIALPNRFHAEALAAALSTDKHVLFEPPAALTPHEFAALLPRIATHRRIVQTDLELRYLPVLDHIRQQIDQGMLGSLLMARLCLWCDWGYGGGEWVEQVQDQGFFLWLGCWYLDVLDAVFEALPEQVSVCGGRAMNGRLMDHGWAVLRYPGDRSGAFEFSLVAVGDTQITLHVAGTSGEMEADLVSGVCRQRSRGQSWQESAHPASEPIHGFAGMRESIQDFVRAVSTGSTGRTGLAVIQRVHEIAFACEQAVEEGRDVAVATISSGDQA